MIHKKADMLKVGSPLKPKELGEDWMKDAARKFLRNVKLVVAAVLGGLLTIFALQNMAAVDLTILFWTFEARRIVVIGVSFVIGLAIGWLVKGHGQSLGE